MNRCPRCKTENSDDLAFCIRCGEKLPPSLGLFLSEHGLHEHLITLQNAGLCSVTDLEASDVDIFKKLLPYGDVLRLRKALQVHASLLARNDSKPEDIDDTPPKLEAERQESTESPPILDASLPQSTEESKDVPESKVSRNYVLMLLSLPTCGFGGGLAGIMAFFQLKKCKPQSVVRSHLRWQTRTFGFSALWAIVLSFCEILMSPESKQVGILASISTIWFYYRTIRGRSLFAKKKAIYSSDPPPSKKIAFGITAAVAIVASAIIGGSIQIEEAAPEEAQPATPAVLPATDNSQSERLAEVQRQRDEAEAKARQAQAEAQRLRQKTEQAQREKEEALQRALEFEKAAETSAVSDSNYGSEVLDFSDAKTRADNGDAYAQAVVSIYYAMGYKSPKDIAMAVQYAMKSAEQGHPLGIYRLGAMRQSGDGMVSDEQQGLLLKSRAFPGLDRMVGDPYAMTAIGIMLFRGESIPKDKSAAARLYKKAADLGYAPAQFTYSACLLSGQGVSKNEALGLQYWQQAYAQNYPPALEGPPR
jgi:TPR repeat protein/uncharacterized membrane protein